MSQCIQTYCTRDIEKQDTVRSTQWKGVKLWSCDYSKAGACLQASAALTTICFASYNLYTDKKCFIFLSFTRIVEDMGVGLWRILHLWY